MMFLYSEVMFSLTKSDCSKWCSFLGYTDTRNNLNVATLFSECWKMFYYNCAFYYHYCVFFFLSFFIYFGFVSSLFLYIKFAFSITHFLFLLQFKKNVADILPPDLSDTWLIKWLRSKFKRLYFEWEPVLINWLI